MRGAPEGVGWLIESAGVGVCRERRVESEGVESGRGESERGEERRGMCERSENRGKPCRRWERCVEGWRYKAGRVGRCREGAERGERCREEKRGVSVTGREAEV